MRKLAAGVAGVVVALVTIQLVEMLGHLVYPPPADIDFGDPQQLRELIASLPVGSILFVGAAWALGAFLGTLAGALLAGSGPLPYAIVVGGMVLAGAGTMLVIFPHPWWFTVAAPAGIIIAAFLAIIVVPRLRPSQGAPE